MVTPGENERARRVAVISDVHGNVPAFEAVLGEATLANPDLFVFGGDLTWGPLPRQTLALVREVERRARFVRGNAERALGEIADRLGRGDRAGLTERERWLAAEHEPEDVAWLFGLPEQLVLEIEGLGRVRFCHGSPRSDEELVTPETPEPRMRALLAGTVEDVVVTAHTHLQFDRDVANVRSVNPGSVGMPYEGEVGIAFWALLGADVDLRRTPYDVEEAVRLYRASGDPLAEPMVETLLSPPTRREVIEHAERQEFSG
jgi:putative phosphoesterase